MKGEIFGSALLVVLSIAGINWAILELFNYNIITTLIPQYAKWIYISFGAVGAFALYGIFKK